MKTWTVHLGDRRTLRISGTSLVSALEASFDQIAEAKQLGNELGWFIDRATAYWSDVVLRGKGGVVVVIEHRGLSVENRKADPTPRKVEVWIRAEPVDLPTDPYHLIRK